ncbi:CRISPR-associated protein Cas4 [Hahella aquimaris]|uniref:CRISPR-associated protein Cas4 n=1 Tax=Hahella sp. HNIBRBA332 TaxID=3015983 RepID=UPI00273CB1E5|nr:CRISPR-associated protein Cas4 [Hahella sp. HNIBRBA332]WLQ16768.1 CRISPR-associated protein Cas4 [Hahella sp. HNIBRBA332]
MEEERLIPLSALQHYIYCPRQCALIHIERFWAENYWTAQGRVLHQRTDEGKPEQRAHTRIERSVEVISHELGVQGVLDVLEINLQDMTYTPVEYKRGKPKVTNCDRVQLCAQALCLEEMRGVRIDSAAIWYWEVRQREWVELDPALRAETLDVISQVQALFSSQRTPRAVYGKYCLACSLKDECQPKAMQEDTADQYLRGMLEP